MSDAPTPSDEARRLAKLHALAVLDSDAEPLFDALTRAAAAVTGRPIALISLVDADRQWFKSNIGLEGTTQTARGFAFCAHTIGQSDVLEVPDARKDSRFADNPLVTGGAHIRFYAGVAIVMGDGSRIGTVCVLDREPGALDATQLATLKALADAAAEAFELRKLALDKLAALEREAGALRQQTHASALLTGELRASESLLERTGRMAGVGGWALDLVTLDITWSAETCRIHEVPEGFKPTLEQAVDFYAPDARDEVRSAVDKAIADGGAWDLQLPLTTALGREIWVRAMGKAEFDDKGQPCRLVGAFQDVTLRRRVTASLEASDRRFRKLFQYSLGLICTHDHEGVLLSVNPAAAQSLGYSIGEMIGRPLTDFMQFKRNPGFREYLLRMMTSDSDAGMMELVAKDGSLRIWQYHNMLDDESDEPYILGHAQDVTAQQQQERRLLEWSIRDPLTGCFNRRYLAELAAEIVAERWGCIAIDLDHFKQVNDTHGHERGDEVLVAMAAFLARRVRPDDAVIRLGGDEFMILLRNVGDAATDGVVRRIDQGRADAPIGFTLGAATFGQGVTLEVGMAEADRRLYQVRAHRPPHPR